MARTKKWWIEWNPPCGTARYRISDTNRPEVTIGYADTLGEIQEKAREFGIKDLTYGEGIFTPEWWKEEGELNGKSEL